MKSSIAFIMTLASLSAIADMKPMGTFIPSQCSPDTSVATVVRPYSVRNICFGKLSGLNAKAIQVQYLVQGDMMFVSTMRVVKSQAVNGGINPNMAAEEVTVVDQTGKQSQLRATSEVNTGCVLSLSGKTPNNVYFSGTKFERVYVTQ